MSTKKIKQQNGSQFLLDLKTATSVMVFVSETNNYFSIQKKELLKEAESSKIIYRMSDKIFLVRRTVMVIF